jgi:hypothetical protein
VQSNSGGIEWFVEHLSRTLVTQQRVTIFMTTIAMNLVTPEAAAKLELRPLVLYT